MRLIDHLGEAVADIDIRPAGVMSVEQLKLCNNDDLEEMAAKRPQRITDSSSAADVQEAIKQQLRLMKHFKNGSGDRLVDNVNGLRALLVLHQRRQNGLRFKLQVTDASKMVTLGKQLAQYPPEMRQAAHPAHVGLAVEADEDDIASQDEVASQQTTDHASQHQDDDEEVQQQTPPQAAGCAGPSTAHSRSKRPLPFEEVVATKMRRLLQQEESLTALQAELVGARRKKRMLEGDVRQRQQQEQLLKQQLVVAQAASAAAHEADAQAAQDVATLEAKMHVQRQLLKDFLQREVVAEFEARWR